MLFIFILDHTLFSHKYPFICKCLQGFQIKSIRKSICPTLSLQSGYTLQKSHLSFVRTARKQKIISETILKHFLINKLCMILQSYLSTQSDFCKYYESGKHSVCLNSEVLYKSIKVTVFCM